MPQLGLWLDPHEPQTGTDKVFISHAHSDHTRLHREVILSEPTAKLMRARLSGEWLECVLPFGQTAELSGPECFYRVEIEPFHRGFALSVDSEKVQAPAAGGSFEIKVTPERRDYDGPITLALDGAGEGFEIVTNVITAKTNATTMKVNVPATLQPGDLINFKITGHAKIDGHDFVTIASTRPALRKLLPHLLWPPAELDGWVAPGITP